MTKLEEYDYAGATAIAVVMLVVSFVLLLAINVLQRWSGAIGDSRGGRRWLKALPARSRCPASREPAPVRGLLIGTCGGLLDGVSLGAAGR